MRKSARVLLIACLLALSLMPGAGMSAELPAALPKPRLGPAPAPTKPPVAPKPFPPDPSGWSCPPGWHHVDDPNFPGACQANQPNPVKCPPSYQWEDNGCTVGCRYIPG